VPLAHNAPPGIFFSGAQAICILGQRIFVHPESSTGAGKNGRLKEVPVAKLLQQLWNDDRGQDIAEYAVMLAVILVIVVGTIRLIGSNANNVFSQVGSSIQ